MTAAFLLHLGILVWSTYFLVRRLSFLKSWSQLVMGVFLLSFSNLVVSQLLLSCVSLLGQPMELFGISTALAALPLWWVRFKKPMPLIKDYPPAHVYSFFVLAIFVVIFTIVATHYPAVPDTLAIKVPKAFVYLQNGNFLPSPSYKELRLFNSPIYGTLLYMFPIVYGFGVKVAIWYSLVAWVLFVLCLWEASRLLKLSTKVRLQILMVFSCAAPIVFQGASDNDDLLSALPFFMGAVFFMQWLQTKKSPLIWFASLGVGLCVGMKLFPLLLGPAAFVVLILYRQAVWKYKNDFLAFLTIVFLVSVPFALINHLGFQKFSLIGPSAGGIANSPFSVKTAFFNVLFYFSQFFITPVLDLISYGNTPLRSTIASWINPVFLKLLPFETSMAPFGNSPELWEPFVYDHSVWFGFISWTLILALRDFKKFTPLAKGSVILFFGWTLTFCLAQKFLSGMSRYWIFPVVLSFPALAYFFEHSKTKYKKYWIAFAMLTSIWFSTNALYRSQRLNLPNIWRGKVSKGFDWKEKEKLLKTLEVLTTLETVHNFPYSEVIKVRGPKHHYLASEKNAQAILLPFLPKLPWEASSMSMKYSFPIKNLCEKSLGFDFWGQGPDSYLFYRGPQSRGDFLMVEWSPQSSKQSVQLVNEESSERCFWRIEQTEKKLSVQTISKGSGRVLQTIVLSRELLSLPISERMRAFSL